MMRSAALSSGHSIVPPVTSPAASAAESGITPRARYVCSAGIPLPASAFLTAAVLGSPPVPSSTTGRRAVPSARGQPAGVASRSRPSRPRTTGRRRLG